MTAKDFESPEDADINNTYEIEITATDNAGNTARASWSVAVIDVAEVFEITAISDATVNENTLYTGPTPTFINGTPIAPVIFTLSGGADKTQFTINSSTGVVSMTAKNFESPEDADINNTYEIEITATDNAGNTARASWSVAVIDVAEVFEITAISDATVNENTLYTGPTPTFINGTPIAPVIFTLSGGADKTQFTINSSTGVVSMTAKNFESPEDADINNTYEIEITATDNAGNTARASWSVAVIDVAEVFEITAISDATVNENTLYTGPTPTFINGTPIAPVIFTLSGGADKTQFTINSSTGVVSMTAKNFESPEDADINNTYEIEITATDNAGNTARASWSVAVIDVAEVFEITAISDATVNENTLYTGPTPTFINGTPIAPVIFTLSGGADKTQFTINSSTGVVSMTAKNFESPEDADINNTYEIEITATDNAGNTARASWSVAVIDVAEVFEITAISDATVNENTLYTGPTPTFINGTPIAPVIFTLSGGADKTQFTINSSTGVVSMTAKNFESPEDADINNTYEIEITATDNAGNTARASWSVAVIDVAEVFEITAISDATVNENTLYTGPTPTFINGTPIAPVIFTLSGGADKTQFTINSSTGVVSMTAKNFESPEDADINNTYEIEITATDNAGNTARASWSVAVIDVAEVFEITAISDATVNENTLYTGPTPTFINGTPIAPVIFTLSGGADKTQFTINSSTGVVSMTAKNFESPEDADINNTYEIEITATDNAGNTARASWSVAVIDVAEVFEITAISDATVNENTLYTGPTPTFINGTPIAPVIFTLSGGADKTQFTINSSTGVVSMTAKNFESPEDADINNTYEIEITATDNAGNTARASWSVAVIDVAEVFEITAISDATVNENTLYTGPTPTFINGTPIAPVIFTLSGGADKTQFTINSSTGVVSMTAKNFESPEDADINNTYEIEITATDNAGNTARASWSVAVIDVAEVFEITAISDATVNENTLYTGPTPTFINGTPIAPVIFTLSGGADKTQFTINSSTGVVSMTAKNFESPEDADINNTYEIEITATDNAGNTARASWSVAVIDVAEVFEITAISDATVNENTLYTGPTPTFINGTPIAPVIFTLSGGADKTQFTINSSTGVVSMTAKNFESPEDADINNTYEIEITATDNAGNTARASWSVAVIDVAEVFEITAISDATVNENTLYTGPTPTFINGTPIAPVIFTLSGGADKTQFTINSSTGVVSMTAKNFESPEDADINNTYEIEITATDNAGNTARASWSVAVIDVAEVFEITAISDATVNENTLYTGPTPTFINGTPIAPVIFTLSGGADKTQFTINSSTGVVSMTAKNFESPEDADINNTYEIEITATDNAGNTARASWSVAVIDVAEVFEITAISDATVNENTLYTGPTPTFINGTPIAPVIFTLSGGADKTQFTINSSTGVVSMTAKNFESPEDADINNTYEIEITATDNAGNTARASWSVAVIDVAEVFEITAISDATVNENTLYTGPTPTFINGTPIAPVIFTLSGGADKTQFTINSSTGVVSMTAKNFESPEDADINNTYEIEITATDNAGNTARASWSVAVIDVAEVFEITAISDATVNENTLYTGPTPTFINGTPIAPVIFTLSGGADKTQFTINSSTGVVSMTAKNFESPEDADINNTYEIEITATDNAGNTARASWSVAVIDVAEVFEITAISDATVNENTLYTGPTPTFINGTPIAPVIFTLSGGADKTQFTINSSTGVVSMTAKNFESPEDADINNTYEIEITATDNAGNTARASWSVAVIDVAEVFEITAISDATVNENTLYTGPTPTFINGTPIAPVIFTLSGGADKTQFTINSSTGVVSMTAKNFESPEDADINNTYEIEITATDNAGNTARASWSVAVIDVAEVFEITAISDATVNENTLYTGPTPTFINGTPIAPVIFTLSGGADKTQFTINSSTGVVSMTAKNFESPEDADINNTYEIEITATDNAGNTARASWSVAVIDVAEVFEITAISDATVNENTLYTGPTPTFINGTPIAPVIFTLSGGADKTQFTINSSTGVVSMTAKNFESPEDADINNTYEIEITATDNAGNTARASWSVAVIDVAEVFEITAISDATVNENTLYTGPTPTFINGTPIAPVIFTLSGGADKTQFTINSSTGVVSMTAKNFESPEDADINNTYEIEITATDNAGNTARASWSVAVIDVAEVFEITAISDATVNENTLYTGPTPTFINGTPIAPVIFTLSGGADKTQFTINSSTGVVSMTAKNFESPEDADINNTYEIEITATDNAGNTARASWSVAVIDVAEVFEITAISDATVNENTLYTGPTPTFINGTPIAPVIFTLSGGADKTQFTINSSTGVVSMTAKNFESPEDADINNTYEIEITATDNAGNTARASWSVAVIDVAEVFEITAISDATVNENTLYTGPTPTFINGTPIAPVIFTLSGGADKTQFTINSSTGVVSMTAKNFESPEDADINNTYEIEITATDNAGNTARASWSVAVIDVAEVFEITAISDATVNENTLYTGPTPTFINGTPIAPVIFTLSGGADKTQFTINSSTGVVSMTAKNFESPEDADINNTYEIEITATDNAGNTARASWSVAVIDVAEVFEITAISDATVNENTLYTGPTPTFINGTPIAPVIFTLSGGADKTQFTINSSTGVVSMTAKNFESPEDADINNTYEIEITATDNAGNTARASWSVAVIDVAEVFEITAISDATVNENTLYTGPTPTFINGTPIAPVIFTLSGGADKTQFTINSSTGVVSMTAKNFESPEDADINNTYEIEITATDNAGNTARASWSVAVIDVAEVFEITAISDATVNENTLYTGPTPTFINGTPIAPVIFTLSGGADKTQFTINSSTGVVSMTAKNFESPEDADINNTYEIEITATDNAGNTARASWSVAVIDVVEVFNIASISDDTVNENDIYEGPTPTLTNGTGTPTAPVTFTLSGGADKDLFNIDSLTGVVSMTAKDFENPVDAGGNNTYEIEITATDNVGNTARASWVVIVEDIQEKAKFEITAIADTTINENELYTGVTPTLTGNTPIALVTFTLSGGADISLFTIDSSTGVVSMTAKDYEQAEDADDNNIYEIEITATDSDGNNDTESWSVEVINLIDSKIKITQVFTPNGDGSNDKFVIKNPEILQLDFEMIIVNRYGNIVYRYKHNGDSSKSPIWWDGSYNGNMNLVGGDTAPEGVYFYSIYFNNENILNKTGWVHLRR